MFCSNPHEQLCKLQSLGFKQWRQFTFYILSSQEFWHSEESLLIKPGVFACNVMSATSSDDICLIEENMKSSHEVCTLFSWQWSNDIIGLKRNLIASGMMMRYKCVTEVIMFNHVRSHLIIDDVMWFEITRWRWLTGNWCVHIMRYHH